MCEERLPSQIQFELCGRCVVCCMSDVREHVRRAWSVCERTQVKWDEKRVQKDGIFGVWSVERQYGAPNGHSSRHIHTHSHGRWQKSFSGFRLENSIVVPGECACTRRALRTVWSRHRSRLKSRYLFFHVIFTLRKILQLLVCVFCHGCFGQWEKTDPFATDKRSFCFVSIQLSFKHCIIRCDETSQKLIAAATTSFAKIQANRKTNATDAEYMCHRR